jgi:hypothetical protein
MEPDHMVRLYWHLRHEGAMAFVEAASEAVAGVPAQFKVLADRHAYRRADAGVLYVDADLLDEIDLVSIERATRRFRRAEVPLLTVRVTDGVGAAMEPATRESFGMLVSRIVAGVVTDLSRSKAWTRTDLERSLSQRCATAEVALPLHAVDSELIELLRRRCSEARSGRDAAPRRIDRSTACLQAARQLGERLASQVIRCDGRATWMTSAVGDAAWEGRPFVAVGVDETLEHGRPGIAHFLSELGRVTGEARFTELACAAVAPSADLEVAAGGKPTPRDRPGDRLRHLIQADPRDFAADDSDETIERLCRFAADTDLGVPGLRSGTAGLGLFLLRVADPTVADPFAPSNNMFNVGVCP